MEIIATEQDLTLDLWAEESGANIAADGCCTNSAATAGSASSFGSTASSASSASTGSTGC
ncbi:MULTISPECIES: hypothetical protein [Amycolatopsis]|uniref:Uncharacterized protein n=1 Tax=Amycolatopsis coloradensis TaxID=76021 RepID=A0ACD5BDM2_9PSEU|nr:hypothetical protein [Amycolatopsis decaplanina]